MRSLPRWSALPFALAACASAPHQPPAEPGPAPAEGAPPVGAARRPGGAPRAPAPIGGENASGVALRWEVAVGGKGRAVAVSTQEKQVAVATGASPALYELATGQKTRDVLACREVLRGGLFFEGRRLFVACERALEVWDARTGKALPGPALEPAPLTAVAFAWPRVALGHDDGVVRILDLVTGARVDIDVPGPPVDVKSLTLTADGARLAVAWVQGSIWWWDVAAPTVPHDLVRHPAESDAVAFSRSGALLAEEGKPGLTTVWAFGGAAPAVAHELRQGDWLKRLLFTADDRWLVRAGSDGLELAELAGPRRVALDGKGQVEDAALDPRGAHLVAIDRAGRLTAWSP